MASIVFTNALRALLSGEIDMHTAGDDIRVALLMTNNTAAAEADSDVVSDISTLDECDGANYVRKALANEAVAADDANTRGEFDADDVVWSSLGNGTREIEGALLFKFDTDDDSSVPIAWIEFAASVNPGGGDLTIQWNAEGILQLTAP